jgi:hypothetical protein
MPEIGHLFAKGLTPAGNFTSAWLLPSSCPGYPMRSGVLKQLLLMVLNEIKSEKLKSEFLFQSCRIPVTRYRKRIIVNDRSAYHLVGWQVAEIGFSAALRQHYAHGVGQRCFFAAA